MPSSCEIDKQVIEIWPEVKLLDSCEALLRFCSVTCEPDYSRDRLKLTFVINRKFRDKMSVSSSFWMRVIVTDRKTGAWVVSTELKKDHFGDFWSDVSTWLPPKTYFTDEFCVAVEMTQMTITVGCHCRCETCDVVERARKIVKCKCLDDWVPCIPCICAQRIAEGCVGEDELPEKVITQCRVDGGSDSYSNSEI